MLLRVPLTDETRAAIHAAFLTHRVLVTEEQDWLKPQQVAFLNSLGCWNGMQITRKQGHG